MDRFRVYTLVDDGRHGRHKCKQMWKMGSKLFLLTLLLSHVGVRPQCASDSTDCDKTEDHEEIQHLYTKGNLLTLLRKFLISLFYFVSLLTSGQPHISTNQCGSGELHSLHQLKQLFLLHVRDKFRFETLFQRHPKGNAGRNPRPWHQIPNIQPQIIPWERLPLSSSMFRDWVLHQTPSRTLTKHGHHHKLSRLAPSQQKLGIASGSNLFL